LARREFGQLNIEYKSRNCPQGFVAHKAAAMVRGSRGLCTTLLPTATPPRWPLSLLHATAQRLVHCLARVCLFCTPLSCHSLNLCKKEACAPPHLCPLSPPPTTPPLPHPAGRQRDQGNIDARAVFLLHPRPRRVSHTRSGSPQRTHTWIGTNEMGEIGGRVWVWG
jgi:hypothetical protein